MLMRISNNNIYVWVIVDWGGIVLVVASWIEHTVRFISFLYYYYYVFDCVHNIIKKTNGPEEREEEETVISLYSCIMYALYVMRITITDTYYVCLGRERVIAFSVKNSKFISPHKTITTSDGDKEVFRMSVSQTLTRDISRRRVFSNSCIIQY